MKLFLVMALFCGSAFADGDQPNGGYTGCTVDCPPPCTENCGSGDGGLMAGEDADSPVDGIDGLDSTDLIVFYAEEYCRMFF